LSLSSADDPKYSHDVWKTLTQWLHSKKEYKPEYLAEPEPRAAIEESCRILSVPLKELSVKQEIPAELTATLENNIFFFSGFKTHHELTEASKLLKDINGNFKPFHKFLKDVANIDGTYNRNYLNAEYNFATASSQMAVKWKEWEADGDDYDLQYRTAGDDRVRDEHASLNNTTLPQSDPFWKFYLPPNDWNCRCTAVQVRKGKHPRSDSEKAIAKGNAMTDTLKKQIFRFNPGAQEKIFPPKHPYYKADNIVREALISASRKNAMEYAVENLIDKTTIKVKGIEEEIHFTKKGVKEAINQPHDSYMAKNNAIKNIQKLIEQNKGIDFVKEDKGNEMVDGYYYLKTKIEGKESLIVLRKIKGGNTIFYSIVNKRKKP